MPFRTIILHDMLVEAISNPPEADWSPASGGFEIASNQLKALKILIEMGPKLRLDNLVDNKFYSRYVGIVQSGHRNSRTLEVWLS